MEGCAFDQCAAWQGILNNAKVKSNFVTCGKILKYLRKYNLLQEDPDTLRELANGPEISGDRAELRNCTWWRLFRILSGTLTIVKNFQGFLGSCSWMHFNIRWQLSYFSIWLFTSHTIFGHCVSWARESLISCTARMLGSDTTCWLSSWVSQTFIPVNTLTARPTDGSAGFDSQQRREFFRYSKSILEHTVTEYKEAWAWSWLLTSV
jgi:hypothetical protein